MALLIILAASSFAQDSAQKKDWTDTEYYKKSKRQRTWAWVSTGVGFTVLLATLMAEATVEVATWGAGDVSGTTAPYIIGGACVATGVVLFVASTKNKRKAKESVVFINMEKTPVLLQTNLRNRLYPAVGVRVNF